MKCPICNSNLIAARNRIYCPIEIKQFQKFHYVIYCQNYNCKDENSLLIKGDILTDDKYTIYRFFNETKIFNAGTNIDVNIPLIILNKVLSIEDFINRKFEKLLILI